MEGNLTARSALCLMDNVAEGENHNSLCQNVPLFFVVVVSVVCFGL